MCLLPGGCLLWGMSAPGGLLLGEGDVSAPRGSSAPGWGVSAPRAVSALGGCLLPRGVCSQGVSALGSVCSEGVSALGGVCIPACTEFSPEISGCTCQGAAICIWP